MVASGRTISSTGAAGRAVSEIDVGWPRLGEPWRSDVERSRYGRRDLDCQPFTSNGNEWLPFGEAKSSTSCLDLIVSGMDQKESAWHLNACACFNTTLYQFDATPAIAWSTPMIQRLVVRLKNLGAACFRSSATTAATLLAGSLTVALGTLTVWLLSFPIVTRYSGFRTSELSELSAYRPVLAFLSDRQKLVPLEVRDVLLCPFWAWCDAWGEREHVAVIVVLHELYSEYGCPNVD